MAGASLMTVLGPIDAATMGITQPHEHLVVDLFDMKGSYDGILEDPRLAAVEAEAFRDAGGRTLVDTTSIGIGRDPEGLVSVAHATGLNVVMGTGWYREPVYPRFVLEHTATELARVIVRELTVGVDETGIRAGVIGELGTERRAITPAQERVFRAAALAQRETGVAITTHTSHYGELALEQLELLTGEGVPADRIVIGHMGDRFGLEIERSVLDRGAFLEIDHVGFAEFAPDERRADHVATLIDEGYLDQLLLSSDTCFRSHLRSYGGRGYGHLLEVFVPMLRARGVTGAALDALLVDNPRRALAVPEV